MSEKLPKRKLIEVSLPLEAINRESAREKSIRHGHPSTLHLWWARRPLAAARAVLFAQLVDDPSAHPDEFPTEEAQQAERKRLHALIERLVVWENVGDESLLAEANEEILKSTDGNPPPIFDPFAGGGTIPLEAQRLGLDAHASDLNPVAVLINKALIEIPPKFLGRPPVFPGLARTQMEWRGAEGLAADVRAYGEWMRDEAEKRIGRHYPMAKLPDGSETSVIAWIWARTITCPNPACRIEMPLTKSWWLNKKKGREVYALPKVVSDSQVPSGKRVTFAIKTGIPSNTEGTMSGRHGATCVHCGSTVEVDYIKNAGHNGEIGSVLVAMVAKGHRRRIYLEATSDQEMAADIGPPDSFPDSKLSSHSQYMGAPLWGLEAIADLFTKRQLTALVTLSDLVATAHRQVLRDLSPDHTDEFSHAYADAVATYLGLALSKTADYSSSLTSWIAQGETLGHVFVRQAVPMIWDFAESSPLSESTGSFLSQLKWIVSVLGTSPTTHTPGQVEQNTAISASYENAVLSTDPPYYDNVPYADLSDFFYVWLRRSVGTFYPDLFSTVLSPKSEELVADRSRKGGAESAKLWFERGFSEIFTKARDVALPDIPATLYYAFKQTSTSDDGTASPGWESILEAIVKSGWVVSATWPLRSERQGRMRDLSSNALASSIVLALRVRADDAPQMDRRGFIAALENELPLFLHELQQGAIAPVDLPQAAIGPGMAVFSRFASVIEADGSRMTVRSALARINEILDQVLNEQEGDFDSTTRFAVGWYRGHGYATGKFGDANNLANARNTSVDAMSRAGVLTSAAGKVTLLSPGEVAIDYDPVADDSISAWEVLIHLIAALNESGIAGAARILSAAESRSENAADAEVLKELAFLLFSIAEKNGWPQDALAFNDLATTWTEIVEASRAATTQVQQASFDLEEE